MIGKLIVRTKRTLAGDPEAMKSLTLALTALISVAALSACQAGPRMPLAAAPQFMSRAQLQAQAAKNGRVTFHVVPDSKFGGWLVKEQKVAQPISSHRTKDEAIAAGRSLAKSQALGQLVIHKANGQIETEYTYGQDPAQSQG